jgi:succinate dehydrogenase flavin-adding protein (antitoxin of CptAB toxin-antitoxin module)
MADRKSVYNTNIMDATQRKNKLLWQARRSMRELDELLLPFVRCHGDALSEHQQLALLRLLEEDDATLCDYVLNEKKPEKPDWYELCALIAPEWY